MMKHLIFFILMTLVSAMASATQVPPQPFCEVSGVVERSDGLIVDITILEVLGTADIGMDTTPSCSDLYSHKTIEDVELVYGKPLLKGQHFRSVITWGGDEFSSGYSMAEVEIVVPDVEKETIDSTNPLFWTRLALLVLVLLIALSFGLFIILKRHTG